jgi:hypothetical protein
MSRHHIHLPPITYMPPPKPKKIDKRRRRTHIQSDSAIQDTDDASPIADMIGLGQAPSAYNSLSDEYSTIDGAESRPKQQSGLLSAGTLKTLLLVQEKLK